MCFWGECELGAWFGLGRPSEEGFSSSRAGEPAGEGAVVRVAGRCCRCVCLYEQVRERVGQQVRLAVVGACSW